VSQPDGRPCYGRMLLKLSGEALMGPQPFGIHEPVVAAIADQLGEIHALGVETAVVVGGGNIIRGLAASHRGIDRVTGNRCRHLIPGDPLLRRDALLLGAD